MNTPTASPLEPQTISDSARVLLVEDNKEHQRLVQFILERLGTVLS